MRQLVIDGNKKTDHMLMKFPEDDVWLSDGEGYFVAREPYAEHLRTAVRIKEVILHICCSLVSQLNDFETPICVEHKAGKNGTSTQKNIDINGSVGCACAPHGNVVPNSMVNMFHGERYVTCSK